MTQTMQATLTITDEQDRDRIIGEMAVSHYADELPAEGWCDPDELEEVCARQMDGRGLKYYIGDVQVSIDADGGIEPV